MIIPTMSSLPGDSPCSHLQGVVLVGVSELSVLQALELVASLVQSASQALDFLGDCVDACVTDDVAVDQRPVAHLERTRGGEEEMMRV